MAKLDYPKHCIGCWKEEDCQQKYFMVADTEPVDGYIDFDLADYVCSDCLDKTHNHQPLFDAESDTPIHCSVCGVPLNCRLTADGVDYVKESIENDNGCCQELWPVLFADYL